MLIMHKEKSNQLFILSNCSHHFSDDDDSNDVSSSGCSVWEINCLSPSWLPSSNTLRYSSWVVFTLLG